MCWINLAWVSLVEGVWIGLLRDGGIEGRVFGKKICYVGRFRSSQFRRTPRNVGGVRRVIEFHVAEASGVF